MVPFLCIIGLFLGLVFAVYFTIKIFPVDLEFDAIFLEVRESPDKFRF
jgi:hypothetical protein